MLDGHMRQRCYSACAARCYTVAQARIDVCHEMRDAQRRDTRAACAPRENARCDVAIFMRRVL